MYRSLFKADHLVDGEIEAVHYFEQIANIYILTIEHASERTAGYAAFVSKIVKGNIHLFSFFSQHFSHTGEDLIDIMIRQLFYGRLFITLCHTTNLPK
jgi:hypothetical protein